MNYQNLQKKVVGIEKEKAINYLKRRLLVSLFVCTLVFVNVACGQKVDDLQETEKLDEDTIEKMDEASIEVDENLLTVELTLPASFFEDSEEPVTQEALDESVADEDGIKSVKLNDDGSVSYIMTKKKQKEMLDEMKQSVDESITSMIENENYSFTEVTYNDNLSKFEVKMTNSELGFAESFSVLSFYMLGAYYNAFAGTDVDDIVVTFINEETSEVIEEAHSKDMAE